LMKAQYHIECLAEKGLRYFPKARATATVQWTAQQMNSSITARPLQTGGRAFATEEVCTALNYVRRPVIG